MNETLLESTRMPSNYLEYVHRKEIEDERERVAFSHRLTTNRTLQNGKWINCTDMKEPGEGITRLVTGPDTIEFYFRDCVWTFSRAAAGSISNYISELFDGQKLLWGPKDNSDANYWLNHTAEYPPPPSKKGAPHLRQMFSYGSFSLEKAEEIMHNVSVAMTTVVRTHYSDGPDFDAKREMLLTTTCVKIDWRWLSFPAAMLGLTGIFLVLVMIDNREVEPERLWRSSALATFFCEVDHDNINGAHTKSKGAMYDIAKSTSVSIDEEGGTLRLVGKQVHGGYVLSPIILRSLTLTDLHQSSHSQLASRPPSQPASSPSPVSPPPISANRTPQHPLATP